MEVNENLYYLIRFVAEFHRKPKAREVYEGRKIGQYLQNLKKGSKGLAPEDAKFLTRLGIKLSTENAQKKVSEKLVILIEFMEKYNRKPNSKDIYKGVRLYTFLRNIQTGNTSLCPNDRKSLDATLKKFE